MNNKAQGGKPPVDQAQAIDQNDLNDLPDMNRRSFFKRTVLGGGAAIATGAVAVGAAKSSLQGSRRSAGIDTDSPLFKQFDQRNTTLLTCSNKHVATEVYPERHEQFMEVNNTDFHLYERSRGYRSPEHYWPDRVGYTQLDMALSQAAGYPARATGAGSPLSMIPNDKLQTWDQSGVWREKYKFGSNEEFATAIKTAARVFGAVRCGIARFDERFNYNPMYHPQTKQTLTWDDVPFKPKSVIVFAVAQDYDGMATAPGFVTKAVVDNGYMDQAKIVEQIAEFVRKLGYKAIASNNDMALNVAYGIMAGLGEGGRNNQLVMPGIGSRARIAKIFTEVDFGDAFDEPRSWGITEFCESCMKCADSCPSGAISREVKPSYEPSYPGSEVEGYTWNNHTGVKKWHPDSKKCFQFWIENNSHCTNCMASCTFNEPDFWHHWLIMAVNPAMPKFVHTLMAEAHPAFGYGGQGPNPIPDKVEKFWKSGKGMRTNLGAKNNIYTAGQA